jgi:hypothetical protein
MTTDLPIETRIGDAAKQRLGALDTILARVTVLGKQWYTLRAELPDAGWKFIGRSDTRQGLLDIVESDG